MSLMDGLELYICIILTIEFWYDYWYNTRENRIKRRKTSAKKDKIVEPSPLLSSSGPKNVEMEPGQNGGPETGTFGPPTLEMREMWKSFAKDRLSDEARKKAKED